MLKKLLYHSFLICSIATAYAGDVDSYARPEIDQQTRKQAEETVNTVKEPSPEAQKQAKEAMEKSHQKMDRLIEKWKERIEYDEKTGKLTIKGLVDDKLQEGNATDDIKIGLGENAYLEPTDRIYIFISSSIPKPVLIEYAKQIVDLGLENRAVMILRGCIGGCTHIKPTLKWISSILHEDGKNKKGIPIQIWIDPLLFHMYGIDKVPCFVFAENVKPVNINLSEGLKYNLKNNPTASVSCGDWTIEYHLKQLYEKTKSEKLLTLLKKIRGGGFYGKKAEGGR